MSVSAWLRFGLVLSVLWLAGLGGWTWISSVGDREGWYAIQLQRCYSGNEAKRDKLRTNDAQYAEMIANIGREYYACTERAKAIFDTEMTQIRSHVWNTLVLHAGVLAAIWLLVLGSVVATRQVVRVLGQQRRADAARAQGQSTA